MAKCDYDFQATWHVQVSFMSGVLDIADFSNFFKHEDKV
jgi:hypothetical protein